MARLPWSGLTPRGWRWRSERDAAEQDAAPRTEGLILSGGGSRASFQLGALGYLYEHAGIAPGRFVGTSAGSILCSVLAQYPDAPGQRAAVAQLTDIWTQMRTSSDMFTEHDWFTRLQAHIPELRDLFSEPEPRARLRWKMPSWGRHIGGETDAEVTEEGPVADGDKLNRRKPDEVVAEPPVTGVDELDPPGPADEIIDGVSTGPGTGAELDLPDLDELDRREQEPGRDGWTPAMVIRLVNALPSLRRAGRELPDIARGYEQRKAMYRPGPVLRRLVDPEVFRADRVAGSGNLLRIAAVCLEDGALYFFDETGTMRDRHDRPVDGDPVGLASAVLASCSIPGVFAPVPLRDRHWVDGAARENLAAEMGLGVLGMDKAWVVVSAPDGVPEETDWDERDIVAVMLRSAAILADETLRDGVAFARSAGAVVIEPELDVHDESIVHPELIRINIDYGWIRAAEVVTEADQEQIDRHRELIAARVALANLTARTDLAEGADDDEAAEIGGRIAELVSRCEPGELPPGAESWSLLG